MEERGGGGSEGGDKKENGSYGMALSLHINPPRALRVFHLLVRLDLTAVDDDDLGGRGARAGAHSLNGLDDIHAIDNLAEHDVLAVQPRGLDGGDEELGAVRVLARVGHGQQTGASVLQLKVLVLELLAVDRLAAHAVAVREVATLDHEVGDDTVELETHTQKRERRRSRDGGEMLVVA